jgi:hypothetical protein
MGFNSGLKVLREEKRLGVLVKRALRNIIYSKKGEKT